MSTLAFNGRFSPVTSGVSRPGSGREAIKLWDLFGKVLTGFKTGWSDRALTFSELRAMEDQFAANEPQAIAQETLILAERFLTALPLDISAPEIGVDPDGDISFDWFGVNNKNFSVSLRRDGKLAYAGAIGPEKTIYGSDRFSDEVSKEIVEILRELQR